MAKKDPSEKLFAMTKKELIAEAERCGVYIRLYWSKDRIVKEVLKHQPIARKTAKLSVEALADGENSFPPSSVHVEPNPKKHLKFVDVKWLGVNQVHQHTPRGENLQIRFERGKWVNIREAIWKGISKMDPEAEKKADEMFKRYSKYYIEEAKSVKPFWAIRIRTGPIVTKNINKKAYDWVETARDFLDDSGEEVILKLTGMMETPEEDLYFGNTHMHNLNMLLALEVEGKHRKTIIDRIKDYIDIANKRDKRNMRTQL